MAQEQNLRENAEDLLERLEELRQRLTRLAQIGEGLPAAEVGRLLGDVEHLNTIAEVLHQQLRGAAPHLTRPE